MPPVSLTPGLSAAIEKLYSVFESYPLPATTNPPTDYHYEADERPLYSRPLRKLRLEDLSDYSQEALTRWGDVDLFRHFLPRIFELAVLRDYSLGSAELEREAVFGKLNFAELRSWPEAEQKAVQQFLLELWRAVLQVPPPADELYAGDEVEKWLCALVAAGGDLASYLDEWLQSSSPAAVWNLTVVITRNGLISHRPRGRAYWKGHTELEQISAWLRSEAVRHKLENAARTYPDEPFTEELTAAARMAS